MIEFPAQWAIRKVIGGKRAALVRCFVAVGLTLGLSVGILFVTTSSATATTGDGHVASIHAYDGSPQSVQIRAGAVAPVSCSGATEGAHETVTTAAEPMCVASRSCVAANTGDDLVRLSAKDSWANLNTLDRHFRDHGADFGAANADEYARMASEFFQRGGAQQLPTKIAPDGTIRMFDPTTNAFGSFAPSGMTKTFFKPTSSTYWSRQPGVLQ